MIYMIFPNNIYKVIRLSTDHLFNFMIIIILMSILNITPFIVTNGSNEVVSLIEEQTASLEEISSLAETLKNMAEQLKIIVNEFKM